jgi:dienelactone hydrolase
MIGKMCAAILLSAAPFCATSCAQPAVPPTPAVQVTSEIMLKTAQGKNVAATYKMASNARALILLFHQAGSDRREYDGIAPRLLQAGYSVLIVDQGGDGLLDKMISGKPDMQAALDWAQTENLPVIIWGSSYSASLTYVLAAEQPSKIKAAMVFSGGDYLGCNVVLPAASRVNIPLFATSSVGETAEMKAIFDLVPSANKQFFAPPPGAVHGSGTLTQTTNNASAEATWVAVLAFIESALVR